MIDSLVPENWQLPDERLIRSHPEFKAAVEIYKNRTLETYEGRYQHTRIGSGIVNYAITGIVLGLHFGRNPRNPDSGATLSRLQDLAAHQGWCSRNKTAAFLSLLHQWGLTTRTRSQRDRRIWRIEPTRKMLSMAKSQISQSFACLDLIFPEKEYLKRLNTDRKFQEIYHATRLGTLLNAQYVCDQVPVAKHSMNYSAGWQLQCKLMAARRWDQGPWAGAAYFPFEEMGQIFGVSRFHVRRFIADSETRGLVIIRENGGKAIEILPAFQDAFERFIAIRLGLAALDADRAISRLYDDMP